MKHQTSSTLDQNDIKNNKPKKIKPVHFLIGFISISFITAFIVGGYFIGKNESKNQQNISEATIEQINIDPVDFPGNPDNWTVYRFNPINLEFKLPDELNKKGEWKTVELNGEKGNILCFSDLELEGNDKCEGKILAIGSASNDYLSAETASFIESQGFDTDNNAYFVKSTDRVYELKNVKFKTFENSNGFEIIKIVGKNTPGTPEENYLGAILNTNNQDYPAITLQMNIDEDISEFEFDQIIESIIVSE